MGKIYRRIFHTARLVMACVVSGAALLVPVAIAHDSTTGVVKLRHHNMELIGGHMKKMVAYVKDGIGTSEELAESARAMAGLARQIPDWFPVGSSLDEMSNQPNGAKPEIWEDFDKFTAISRDLVREANKMAEIAEMGGERGAAGQQLGIIGGKGCKACHQSFRKELN